MVADYGKSEFKEIGILSSQLPSYVRHCCRSLYDGTDEDVLEAFRTTSYRVLSDYRDKYKFAGKHAELLQIFNPETMKDLITSNKQLIPCLATQTHQGLPKRACLHCPKVALWIKRMSEYGTIDDTGQRRGYKQGADYGRDGYQTE